MIKNKNKVGGKDAGPALRSHGLAGHVVRLCPYSTQGTTYSDNAQRIYIVQCTSKKTKQPGWRDAKFLPKNP